MSHLRFFDGGSRGRELILISKWLEGIADAQKLISGLGKHLQSLSNPRQLGGIGRKKLMREEVIQRQAPRIQYGGPVVHYSCSPSFLFPIEK